MQPAFLPTPSSSFPSPFSPLPHPLLLLLFLLLLPSSGLPSHLRDVPGPRGGVTNSNRARWFPHERHSLSFVSALTKICYPITLLLQ